MQMFNANYKLGKLLKYL